jgi:CheY-specific phosphatase CheX
MSVGIKVKENTLVVQSNDVVFDQSTVQKYISSVDLNAVGEVIVFDLSKIKTAKTEALKELADTAEQLKDKKGQFIILSSKELFQAIQDAKLDGILKCYLGVESAVLATRAKTTPRLSIEELLKLMLKGVEETFKSYAKVAITTETAIRCEGQGIPSVEIAGVGSFICNDTKGMVTLAFPLNTYLGVISRIMKKEYKQIAPEVRDWASEFINSSLGQVKRTLSGEGYNMNCPIPTAIQGNDLKIFHTKNIPFMVVPCNTDFGQFYVELILDE